LAVSAISNSSRAWFTGGTSAIARDILAGSVCGIVSVAFGLSFAALIFSGPLTPWLAYGIAASFVSSSIAGLVVAGGSSLRISIAGPDSSTSAVTAALVGTITQHLAAAGASDRLLVASLVIMPISSALTGLLLCSLGTARAGRAIRFVPYPVVGGFLGATGLLVMLGACQVINEHRFTLAEGLRFITLVNVSQLAAGIAVATLLFLFLRIRVTSVTVMPGILLLSTTFTYVVLAATHTPLADARATGWLFKIQAENVLDLPWHAEVLDLFPWTQLPSLAGELIAVMFVTAISTLLNVTGIEYATHREANLDRELVALGVANLCSAVAGGYVSCISLSRTLLNHAVGATSRLSGMVVALMCAFVLAVDPALLGYIPKFVLGGLLFYLGASLIYQWLVNSAARLSLPEYLSLLAIAIIIMEWGFIAGVLLGVVIGCATFALSASRVNSIKYSFDGSEVRSSLDRGPTDLATLTRCGPQIQGMSLHSYLFFGSASRLYQHVKELLARQPECHFLIFDFRLVTGVDSSATHSFTQIKRAADQHGAQLVLVHLTREIEKAFRTIHFVSDDILVLPNLDQALEVCEDAIIKAAQSTPGQAKTLQEWFKEALGTDEYADFLTKQCRRMEFAAGDIIARQGEPADTLHFILEGRVSVLLSSGEEQIRIRSLGPHTTVGEMGLISRQPRSATIRAETRSVLYALSLDRYEHIKLENPTLGQALLSYIISVMTERLSFASRVIGVLQR